MLVSPSRTSRDRGRNRRRPSRDPKEHEESHDADSTPIFGEVPNDEPEHELHSANNALVGRKWNPVVDPWTVQDVLEAGTNACHTPRKSLDKAYLQLESSVINQAKRVLEARKTSAHLPTNQNEQRQ